MTLPRIESVRPVIGMEIHVELRTRRKVFAPSASPAHSEFAGARANTLLDPVVMALPGALPVLNREAVEQSVLVGLAMGSAIAERAVWDRKGYAYPDLPKGYQISQAARPVCEGGGLDVWPLDERGVPAFGEEPFRVGLIRAHLEEDAGKLMHEAPGGGALDGSIVDLNRAGAALLEIVTEPCLSSADEAVAFCRQLHRLVCFLGVTEGVMQQGHVRFEPNVNCVLTLEDGDGGTREVRTPIVEVKNLNSFRAVKGAIEHELSEQPGRWAATGREHGPGMKQTRGWDDAKLVTTVQREKEDADDYRYFPDPDLPAVEIDEAWRAEIGSRLVGTPAGVCRGLMDDGLTSAEAWGLTERAGDYGLFAGAVEACSGMEGASKAVANVLLQEGLRLVNEGRARSLGALGVTAGQVARVARLRGDGAIDSSSVGALLEALMDRGSDAEAEAVAGELGLVMVRDDARLAAWADEVIAANPGIAEQVRGGKVQAVGRLIGEVKKLSAAAGGPADAKAVRAALLERLGVEGGG